MYLRKNCYCGNSYGMYGNGTDCNAGITCPAGDLSEVCGTATSNIVFETGFNFPN